MPLINCEVSLTLTWSENYVLNDIATKTARAVQGDNPAREKIDDPKNAIFKITNTKLINKYLLKINNFNFFFLE